MIKTGGIFPGEEQGPVPDLGVGDHVAANPGGYRHPVL